MTITQIIDGIIAIEKAKFTNDPADPGGPTKYGITQKTLSGYLGKKATIAQVKALTEAQARTIYRLLYIKQPRFDTLPDPLRVLVVDTGVNHGVKTATKILQRAVNAAGAHIGHSLKVDGSWGPKSSKRFTVLTTNQRKTVYAVFIQERLANYAKQVRANVMTHDRKQRQHLQSLSTFGQLTDAVHKMKPVNKSTKLRFLVGWIDRGAGFIGG